MFLTCKVNHACYRNSPGQTLKFLTWALWSCGTSPAYHLSKPLSPPNSFWPQKVSTLARAKGYFSFLARRAVRRRRRRAFGEMLLALWAAPPVCGGTNCCYMSRATLERSAPSPWGWPLAGASGRRVVLSAFKSLFGQKQPLNAL